MIIPANLDLSSPLGRTLKKLADSILPKGMIVPILQGPNRGMKWILGSSSHSCWLGSYERAKQKPIQQYLKAGMTAYDLGANVGYYSLFFSRLVGEQGKVYAFEPFFGNCRVLQQHLKLNRLKNVVLSECAVSDVQGEVLFYQSQISNQAGTIISSSVTEKKESSYKIPTISLDYYVYTQGNNAPDLIKMDIEGAEYFACLGMEKILLKQKPVIFMAFHGVEVWRKCFAFLKSLHYKIVALDHTPLEVEQFALEAIALPNLS